MKDADGNEVRVGDVVKVLTVDPTFLECLIDEEKTHHVAMVRYDYIIDEIQLAARGRVAHSDGIATFDQVVTEPAHQRKGLGRVIMATLGNVAIAQEARVGVLVATEQGRALYQAIGWTLVSLVTAAVIA